MGKKRASKETKTKATEEVHLRKELELAYSRISAVPARRLKWLLRFSELDLEGLSEGELANLRWELNTFMLNRKPEELGHDYRMFLFDLSPALIKDLQARMRDVFDSFFTPQGWLYKQPERIERISSGIRGPEGQIYASNPPSFTVDELFIDRAADLIRAEKMRLKICERTDCGERFVAEKKFRGRFCSPKCSAIVRMRKRRGKI